MCRFDAQSPRGPWPFILLSIPRQPVNPFHIDGFLLLFAMTAFWIVKRALVPNVDNFYIYYTCLTLSPWLNPINAGATKRTKLTAPHEQGKYNNSAVEGIGVPGYQTRATRGYDITSDLFPRQPDHGCEPKQIPCPLYFTPPNGQSPKPSGPL
ncbi:hypothetical protein VTJ04DRAFT_1223 [Mycothermus thermophilus]|uniref:uncharacterized protein n=1 Tax=Humicola insolens TaxID=85995 RepID=UPI0037433E37